eukprot:4813911-Karenia_brevis.AAC.1
MCIRDSHEGQLVSHCLVTAARNGFCELLKHVNREDLRQRCMAVLPGVTVVVIHVHDESYMRVRSFDSGLGSVSWRAKYAQVWNYFMTVTLA